MAHTPLDPVDLTARLIRCPSVTPEEGGALQLLEAELAAAGFVCTRIDRAGVPNLFARWGDKGANRALGFNGHTDVVPVGDLASWTRDPFGGEIDGGRIWGPRCLRHEVGGGSLRRCGGGLRPRNTAARGGDPDGDRR